MYIKPGHVRAGVDRSIILEIGGWRLEVFSNKMKGRVLLGSLGLEGGVVLVFNIWIYLFI